MIDIIKNPDFQVLLNEVLDTCKKTNNPVAIAVSDSTGEECYVAADCTGEDLAFMCAEQIFCFAKDIAEKSPEDMKMSVQESTQILYKQLTRYLNDMILEYKSHKTLLDEPWGRA